MRRPSLFRALALFLSVQPVFWMSNVALAQSLLGAPQGGDRSLAGGPSQGQEAPPPSTPIAPAWPMMGPGTGPTGLPGAAPTSGLAVERPVDPDRYVLGQGDVLELNFWGLQNLRLPVVVDIEGRAFVPKVGYFVVAGKTLAEARRVLRQAIAPNYPRLEFDIGLAEPRTFLVQVADDVVRPGTYPARAIDRVAAVINRAGGFGPNASKRRIEIQRRDGSTVPADLLLYELTGDVKHNPELLDGDVVRVPFEAVVVRIGGAVNRPGRYELVGAGDLEELVELAGGLAPGATRELPIALQRRGEGDLHEQRTLEFPASGLPQEKLRHEDYVELPAVAELQRTVTVVGAIAGAVPPTPAAPGPPGAAPPAVQDEAVTTRRMAFAQGDTVRRLLERVGGLSALADLGRAHVLRRGERLPVDLDALLVRRDRAADLALEVGDTLVVPFRRRSILVQGAVVAPGVYPYDPTYGAERYLTLAGGPNRFSQSYSNVRVVSPSGERRRYKPGLTLEPGSTLVVPERNFTRTELVQIGISIASVLISGVAVVIAARR